MMYRPLFPQVVNIWYWGDDAIARHVLALQERYRKTWDTRQPTRKNRQGNMIFPVKINGEWIWG